MILREEIWFSSDSDSELSEEEGVFESINEIEMEFESKWIELIH